MAQPGLETYRAKRDFARTPEPAGRAGTAGEGVFVVQKHAARRLHYDFRLAHRGVLLSWAVTRSPSMDPRDKRLAVRTEDHPLDYAEFEGVIPHGEYGGGTVMLWDRGRFAPVTDLDRGLQDGKVRVDLKGQRLRGRFALLRMRPDKGARRENWLLVKERDATADPGWDAAKLASSIATGRSMAEIAGGAEPAGGRPRAPKAASDGAGQPRARSPARPGSRLPPFVGPQLATLVDQAPEGDRWLHEVKYDGYRLIAAACGSDVRLYTRSGQDWTDRFATIADALRRRGLPATLMDGEVVVAGSGGRSDFGSLQRALRTGAGGFAYFVFDLLVRDGVDLRDRPLQERKAALRDLLATRRDALRYSDHAQGAGDRVTARACRLGLEGIVSKRADSPYRSTRNGDWRKVKCVRRQEFVVGGWSPSRAGRPFASLLLGVWEEGVLRYVGRVGSGFDRADLERLGAALAARRVPAMPFAAVPSGTARAARWCRPEIAVEVAFTEFTGDGHVRHGVFLGVRDDKPAGSISMEVPRQPGRRREAAPDDAAHSFKGVTLTHPDRQLYPAMGTTKRDLAEYLAAVAPRMLPHLRGRPVSLVRCPQGRSKNCFFQRHAGPGVPRPFGRVSVPEKDGATKEYLLVESAEALVACAQIGVLELHVWGCRKDSLEKPDRLVFDLDPGEGVGFAEVRRAAQDLAAILEEGGLRSFPLVTGGKGVHLVVPVARRQSWPEFSRFARGFAEKVASLDPERFVATMRKVRRKGRIFIDHFRNQRSATAIAPYSPRAREGGPVAVPVGWGELAGLSVANGFSLTDAAARLDAPDPWEGYGSLRQSLTAAKLRRIGLADLMD